MTVQRCDAGLAIATEEAIDYTSDHASDHASDRTSDHTRDHTGNEATGNAVECVIDGRRRGTCRAFLKRLPVCFSSATDSALMFPAAAAVCCGALSGALSGVLTTASAAAACGSAAAAVPSMARAAFASCDPCGLGDVEALSCSDGSAAQVIPAHERVNGDVELVGDSDQRVAPPRRIGSCVCVRGVGGHNLLRDDECVYAFETVVRIKLIRKGDGRSRGVKQLRDLIKRLTGVEDMEAPAIALVFGNLGDALGVKR
jgi:hypothetical protein